MAVFSWLSRIKDAFSTPKDGSGGTFTAGDSYVNRYVTAENALMLSTVWACVRIVSQSMAMLPFGIYRFDENDNKVIDKSHPLYRILHDQPNAAMTAFEFWEAAIANILLKGNCYCEIKRRPSDKAVISLNPLITDNVSLDIDETGATVYVYNASDGQIRYKERDVLHLKGFSQNGRVGMSAIAYGANSLGGAQATDEAANTLFNNGMQPAAALKTAQNLSPEQRDFMRKQLANKLENAGKTGRTIILEAGLDYQQLSLNAEDAQLLETRSFQVEDVCKWFGVPPAMIGHTQQTTTWGTGLEQMNLGFLTYTLAPFCKRIEQATRKALLLPGERDEFFPEFNIEGFMRADSKGRSELYKTYVTNGIMTRNEIRRKENMAPLPGGDELTAQSQFVPISMLGKITSTMPPSGDPANDPNADSTDPQN